MGEEVLVRVEGLSKKFCRSLKRSLWYGLTDTLSDLAGRDGSTNKLRPAEFWALNDVSFELRGGECLGLIGRNGAGKTTLLKLLNGLIKPDNGRIEIHGRLGALIALGAGFNPILSGRENIYVNASVLGLSKREINQKINNIIDFAEIGEFIDAPVQTYSSGMVVRLGFAVAAATEPDVLLLDEVLAVGDVRFQAKCLNTLAEFRKRGAAFVFVSHNMHMISRYSQKVIYVRDGHVRHFGDVETSVGLFFKDMETTSPDEALQGPDWTRTLGSGRIRLLESRFLNAKNEAVNEIDVGEPVTLVLRYERLDASIKSAILDLVIRDRDEEVYRSTNIAAGTPLRNFCNAGQLAIRFEYVPVNTDYLNFSFALIDEATGEVYDWKRNLRLSVRRRPDQHGKLALPTKWRMASFEQVANPIRRSDLP